MAWPDDSGEKTPGSGDVVKRGFNTTSWSAVSAASKPESPEAKEALARLCQTYWEPLYAYLRRVGKSETDAKDLTQEFFYVLLSKNYLGAADRQKGKFRSFLLTALKHFLANEWDRSQAQKRGGGKEIVSLEAARETEGPSVEPASALSPAKTYERRWAMTLFTQTQEKLRQDYVASGKEKIFDALRGFLDEATDTGQYAAASEQLKMSLGAVRMAVHRLRQQFGELVRSEVAATLINPTDQEINEELRHLMEAFSRE